MRTFGFLTQEDLTSLGQWEADWQMKFNVAKCHSMRVTRHQHHKQILFDYSLHNQTLENVQSAKYLGITISDNMDCFAGPRSAVGNVSGYRCVSDCRSRGREFDPGPVPSFRGD